MTAQLLLVPALMGLTIGAYAVARPLFLRYRHPLLNPVFVGSALVISVLALGGVSYESYVPAKELLTWPLGPVTVALAVPVYRQRALLGKLALPLGVGVLLGTLSTIAAVLALAAIGRLDGPVLGVLSLKSVTAPIAVELAKIRGGDPSLVAAFVVMTGTIGAMLGPIVLSAMRIRRPAARGIALGTISHGQGTAAALNESEVAGAMSTLAMAAAAITTSTIAPAYTALLLHVIVA